MTPLSEPLLVVDSDAPGRMALDAGLRQAGFAVETAADVEEALRKARQKIPALVVSETALKTSDGFELCRRLKEDEQLSQIPFLFVTHNKSIEGKIQGLEVGSVGYVTKPVSLNQLLEHIRQVLSPQDA
ncbi:MAG: response regulator, partial [Proteobacteria bacterium]|nr:response regulator [Pseudomonadota bacterium]